MKGFAHESIASSVPIEWYTPPEIFEALGITFDLDPCSPPFNRCSYVPARNRISLPDDGLATKWDGNVWLNPPYGRQTPIWLKKLSEHGCGIALTYSRTDTSWFQDAARKSTGVIFIAKRIKFINGETGQPGQQPGAGSCLIIYGEENWTQASKSNLGVAMCVHKSF